MELEDIIMKNRVRCREGVYRAHMTILNYQALSVNTYLPDV